MRSIYRLVDHANQTALMAAVMRRGTFDYENDVPVRGKEFPQAFSECLVLMRVASAYALKEATLVCVPIGSKKVIEPDLTEFTAHLIVLHAQPGVMMVSGEDASPLAGGEVWWYDRKNGLEISNNSQDDLVYMHVSVLVDE